MEDTGRYRLDYTRDLRVRATEALVTPQQLRVELPLDAGAARLVARARQSVAELIKGSDERLLVVVGPCSVHDPRAALEYAKHLLGWRERYGRALYLVMRVYFEKPRTSTGWKGLINDPHLDGSCDVPTGLRWARRLLLELAEQGIPTATEFLDPMVPQYLADLVVWAAIGARTTESQTHREMASGLSMPVGFKNGTDGSLAIAVNGMRAARGAHSFLGIDEAGRASVVRTTGNPHVHAVLRGGASGPNYDAECVAHASSALADAGMPRRVLIDCSHANSGKDYRRQPEVAANVAAQVERHGSSSVLGVMLESHLRAGRQDVGAIDALVYGQSITDACIDIAGTEAVLDVLAGSVTGARFPAS